MVVVLPRVLVVVAGCLFASIAAAQPRPKVEVFMPTPCLACIEWGVHLMDNGFAVTYRETSDMAALKRRLKVPAALESVHTAMVEGYFVEGHVPAEDIKVLLAERPPALGLAVPGLPRGAPGREITSQSCESGCSILEGGAAPEGRRDLYETLLVSPNGKTSTWARH